MDFVNDYYCFIFVDKFRHTSIFLRRKWCIIVKSLLKLPISVIASAALLWPQASSARSDSGSSSAYNFLDIPSSSHIYGLGSVNISTVDDDINGIIQNPALLGPEFDLQAGFNYMRYIADADFTGAIVGGRAGLHSGWAARIQYYGYGKMTEMDELGNTTGSFSPKDISIGGIYSHDITERLRGGIAINVIYSGYHEYSALALATDLGINYYNPDTDLSLSAVVANLGGQIKRFNETYDRLPIDIRLGWTKSFGSFPVRFSATAWGLTEWHLPYFDKADGLADSELVRKESFGSNLFRHLIFAADFVPGDRFHAGIGYNHRVRTDMASYSRDLLSGFSFCAGLKVKSFSVGAAFARPHSGASTFMLNLSTNISDL